MTRMPREKLNYLVVTEVVAEAVAEEAATEDGNGGLIQSHQDEIDHLRKEICLTSMSSRKLTPGRKVGRIASKIVRSSLTLGKQKCPEAEVEAETGADVDEEAEEALGILSTMVQVGDAVTS